MDDRKVLALFALFACILWAYVANPVVFAYDQSKYYAEGLSLRTGGGFVRAWIPGQPPETTYPPLYPFLLAGGMLLFKNFLFLKSLNLALHIASAYLLYMLGKKLFTGKIPLLASAIFLLCPIVLFYSTLLLAESLFVFLLLATLLAHFSGEDGDHKYYLIGFLAALAVLSRAVGVALALGLLADLLYRRHWRPAAQSGAAFLLTLSPYLLYLLRNGSTYLSLAGASSLYDGGGTIASKLAANLSFYLLLPSRFGGIPALVLSYAILAVLLWFYAKQNWSRLHLPLIAFSALYLLILLWWPYRDLRFLVPLVPVACLLFASSFMSFESRYVKKETLSLALMLGMVFAAALAGSFLFRQYSDDLEDQFYGYISLARAMSVSEGDTVLCRHTDFHIYSGKYTVGYPLSSDRDELAKAITISGADYFIKDSFRWTDFTEKYYSWLTDGTSAGPYCFSLDQQVGQAEAYKIEHCK